MARILHKNQERHGYHGTDVYKIWGSMVKRCENEKSSNFKYYGGRGISVCNEWRMSPKTFCEWALSNGFKKGLEIDRKDVDGDYNPNNCHFITHKENCAPFKRSISSANKTGHIGISISKNGRYEAYANIDGKQRYLGVRKTIKEALRLQNEFISEITGNIHDNIKGKKQ